MDTSSSSSSPPAMTTSLEQHSLPINTSQAGEWLIEDNATTTQLPLSWTATWTNNTSLWNMSVGDLNASLLLADSNTTLVYPEIDDLEGYPYPSKYPWVHIILASIVVTFIIACIVIGNTLVIVAIAVDHNLKAIQNWFIASLAVSDLLLGLLIMPFSLANELMGYWFFGEIMCQLWLSIDVLLCTASILNLCLISLDRYWSITRAISYVKTRTKRRAIVMIGLVWVLSAIICFPPLAGWKRPQPHKYGFPLCVLSEEIGYVVYSTMGSFYIPLAVMVIVYFKIYLAARKRARKNLKSKKPMQPENGNVGGGGVTNTTSSSTSFSKGGEKKPPEGSPEKKDDEGSSDLEEEAEPLSQIPEGGESTDPGMESGAIPLSVTNHNAHMSAPADEKRQLLADDTDNEGPVWQLQNPRLNRGLQLSEDTDSQLSDADGHRNGHYRQVPTRDKLKDSDNLKPLLEDSHPESDSQRDSDKNCNQIRGGDAKTITQSPGQQLPKVHVTKPKDSRKFIRPRLRKEKTSNTKLLQPVTSIRRLSFNKKDKKDIKIIDPEKQKRKIARARERRATIVLGIIMATFILCWLPFFTVYLLSVLIGFPVPGMVFAVMFWGGYCNSALNPLIYTIFNMDFRKAFKRLVFGRRYGR